MSLITLVKKAQTLRDQYNRTLAQLLTQIEIQADLSQLTDEQLQQIYYQVRNELKKRGFIS